jgi:RNA recognition motif-containing protein
VSDKAFREFFEQFGTVVDSIVMLDRVSKTGRGFGFVTFEDENVAKLLLCSGSNKGVPPPPGGHTSCKLMIHGRMCEIKLSEPKKIESQSNMSSESSLTVPEQIQFQNGYAPPSDAASLYQTAGYMYPTQQIYPPQDATSAYYYYDDYPTATSATTTATQVGYNNNYYQYSTEQGAAYYPQDGYYYYPPQYYQYPGYGGPTVPTFDPYNAAGHYGDNSQYFYQPNNDAMNNNENSPSSTAPKTQEEPTK